jgi:hypothetical protein
VAGVALVFPVLMLMQMMSNGGIGGGVSSAVARALGANRQAGFPGVAAAVPAFGRILEIVFPFDIGNPTGAPQISDQAVTGFSKARSSFRPKRKKGTPVLLRV